MNKKYCLTNGKIILADNILENKVLIFNEKITDIIGYDQINKHEDIEIIDVDGKYISPGFIDIHIHGARGYDTMDGSLNSLMEIGNTIKSFGVTGFLPTTMTTDINDINSALESIKKAMISSYNGSKILGCHLEGPFINKKYKGAQREEYILKPNYDLIREHKDTIKIITMAPEVDNALDFIDKVKNNTDIVLSIGHSGGSYIEAMEGIKRGISHSTHIFNAMKGLHHREPGVVGAIFNSDITCELIGDNLHVHPGIYQLLINIKGIDNIILITDSIRATNMKDGVYGLACQDVIVDNNTARLKDGTLAGSLLALNKGVKNILENSDIKIYEAVKMASLNPSRLLNIDDAKGSIEVGKDADITVFDDDFNVSLTIVDGKVVYKGKDM